MGNLTFHHHRRSPLLKVIPTKVAWIMHHRALGVEFFGQFRNFLRKKTYKLDNPRLYPINLRVLPCPLFPPICISLPNVGSLVFNAQLPWSHLAAAAATAIETCSSFPLSRVSDWQTFRYLAPPGEWGNGSPVIHLYIPISNLTGRFYNNRYVTNIGQDSFQRWLIT